MIRFKYKLRSTTLILMSIMLFSQCTVIKQGEFGVKRTFGKYSDKVYTSGLKTFNPITSSIVKVSGQTENLEVSINIHSTDGLPI